ncbi:MAG: hypothetical protein CVU11_05750 [Bacteroidetes bacterium HGW-Bacteroidetes-6]|jgi:hypothetical protein|nr:MAG: hypothetical protein CVU11_05750 [Bacteroidetes bacterium HGW-Bacteroidetes-6]
MKLTLPLIFILTLLLVDTADAQMWRRDRKEYVFSFGATNFLGDLGGANQIGTNGFRDLDWPSTRPLVGIGYRYRTGASHCVKGMLHVGYLHGDDALTEEPIRQNRNLNFRTPVVELNGQFEWMLTKQREGHIYKLRGVHGWRNINIESYLFAGVGIFWMNPQGRYINGSWVNLKPLCTEGQGLVETRNPYHRLQLSIPVGFGFKYAISREWSIGLEYGIRKTFTDYIDDASTTYYDNNEIRLNYGDIAAYMADPSFGEVPTQTLAGEQRGDPTDKDAFMFAELTFFYKIPRGGFAIPKF